MGCAITNGYSLPCRTNQGGIKAVYVGTFNDTAMTFTYGTVSTLNEILAVGGTTVSFYTVSQRQEQGMLTYNLVPSVPNGTTYYDQTVEVVIEQVDNLKSNWANILAQGLWRVIVLDNLGSYWMVGLVNGAYVTTSVGGPNKGYGDGNKLTITFMAKEPLSPTLMAINAATTLITGP